MKNWSNKTLTLFISIILLAVNGGLLFSYYNFYLSDKIASDLASARTKNHNSIYIITKSIEGKTKLNEDPSKFLDGILKGYRQYTEVALRP